MGHSCRSSERLWMICFWLNADNDKDTLLEVQSPMSELHGNQVLLASTRSHSSTAARIGSATWGSSPLCESVSLLERVLPMWWTSSGFIIWMPSPQQSPSPQRTVSLQRLRLKGSDCRLLRASPTGGFPSASAWLSHHGSPTFDNEFVERESPLQKDYLNR